MSETQPTESPADPIRTFMRIEFRDFARLIEHWILPLYFAYFLLEQVAVFYANRRAIASAMITLPQPPLDYGDVTFLLFFFVRVLLLLFNGAVVVYLLKSPQRHVCRVERARDALVPVLSTFFITVTNLLAYSPTPIETPLVPGNLNARFVMAGLLLTVAGAALSLLSILYLGDSFAVFVERRTLVRAGPYRYFRHPIYLGHGLRMLGYWLMTTMKTHLVFSTVAILMLIYRARLEEERLAQEGATFARYREDTERSVGRVTAGFAVLALACVLLPSMLPQPAAAPPVVAQVDGPGLPVVFVHGAAGSKAVWSSQLEHLSGRHKAAAIDLRPYAPRPGDDGGAVASGVADVESVAGTLGLKRFVLVGHSMGSYVIIAYAQKHPDQVAGLMLVDPSDDYRWLPRDLKKAWVARFNNPGMRRALWDELLLKSTPRTRDVVLADLAATPEPSLRSIGSTLFSFDPGPAYKTYKGRKLAVFSSCKEEGGPPHRFTPTPRRCMSGVSHWMMLDDPQRFDGILDDFLAGVPAGGSGR